MSDTTPPPPNDGDGDGAAIDFGGIEPIEIQDEMERSFLDYSMSVITAGPARRPRRPQAGPPPDPVGHGRHRRPARPQLHEVRPGHR
jgi:hypothetical protein